VLISATALPPRMTLMLGGFAIACATVLIFVHDPLPWDTEPPLELPQVYVMGVWLSILLAIAFIGLHAWQVTEEARQLADALAATELVLAREQHLSQLDGLAAAAAHELGTPLATITLIAKELQLQIKPDSEHADDVRLLNEQAKRCRAILGKLTELSSGDPFDRMKLSSLIEEVVAPHRNFGVAIDVALSAGDAAEPVGGRNPAILYGLGNLLENAVDFARARVEVAAAWSKDDVAVTIIDDGPGFAPEIMDRIGEPYVTSRPRERSGGNGQGGQPEAGAASGPDSGLKTGPEAGLESGLEVGLEAGLGLGFFIAKTLLERSGAQLEFENRASPDRGAVVRVHWGRRDFERPVAFAL
jgi:two-component system sensor histidine kinase RegB